MNLNKKLILFDYFLGKLIKWYRNVKNLDPLVVSNNDILKRIANACLQTVDKDIGLFKIFNQFRATENGYAKENLYINRGEFDIATMDYIILKEILKKMKNYLLYIKTRLFFIKKRKKLLIREYLSSKKGITFI